MKARLIELTSFKLFSQATKTVRKYIMLANDLKHVLFITGNSIYFLLLIFTAEVYPKSS